MWYCGKALYCVYDQWLDMQWIRNLSLKSLYFFPGITLIFPGSKHFFLPYHSVENIEKFNSWSF